MTFSMYDDLLVYLEVRKIFYFQNADLLGEFSTVTFVATLRLVYHNKEYRIASFDKDGAVIDVPNEKIKELTLFYSSMNDFEKSAAIDSLAKFTRIFYVDLHPSFVVNNIPGIMNVVDHPKIDGMVCLMQKRPFSNMIMHLNDDHKWTREQIADWLDTLDSQPTFGEKV